MAAEGEGWGGHKEARGDQGAMGVCHLPWADGDGFAGLHACLKLYKCGLVCVT